jgi:hypothetical protein
MVRMNHERFDDIEFEKSELPPESLQSITRQQELKLYQPLVREFTDVFAEVKPELRRSTFRTRGR